MTVCLSIVCWFVSRIMQYFWSELHEKYSEDWSWFNLDPIKF